MRIKGILTKGIFTVSEMDNFKFEGFTYNELWNGWDYPYFTKEVAFKIIEKINVYEKIVGWYNEERNTFYIVLDADKSIDYKNMSIEELNGIAETYEETKIVYNGKEIKVFDIGSGNWTWQLENILDK